MPHNHDPSDQPVLNSLISANAENSSPCQDNNKATESSQHRKSKTDALTTKDATDGSSTFSPKERDIFSFNLVGDDTPVKNPKLKNDKIDKSGSSQTGEITMKNSNLGAKENHVFSSSEISGNSILKNIIDNVINGEPNDINSSNTQENDIDDIDNEMPSDGCDEFPPEDTMDVKYIPKVTGNVSTNVIDAGKEEAKTTLEELIEKYNIEQKNDGKWYCLNCGDEANLMFLEKHEKNCTYSISLEVSLTGLQTITSKKRLTDIWKFWKPKKCFIKIYTRFCRFLINFFHKYT